MGLISEIPELKDVLAGELAERGTWAVASVDARMSWPVTAQKVQYRGVDIWVLPVTKDNYPGIALNLRASGKQEDEAEGLILQFLSTLSWIENGGVLVEQFTRGWRPEPARREKRFGFGIQDDFDFSYFPEPSDEKAQLALAIMREGRGLNHPAYAFLSFYRVLEVAVADGRKRGEWITAHIERIANPQATEIIGKLKADGVTDIGEHLQKSGRQAIAHARSKPIINPDDPRDARRLRAELPIIEALAMLAVEEELGVKTRQTTWREHLYELEGFKKILGPERVAAIAKGETPGDTTPITFPQLSIELRRRAPYKALANLQVISLEACGPVVALVAQSHDEYFRFRCHLDFANERLHFDVLRDIAGKDDGSAECAERHAEAERFIYDYLCNGELRILDSATQALLSRKDAFIPMNCYVNDEFCKANIEGWLAKAQERRSKAVTMQAETPVTTT